MWLWIALVVIAVISILFRMAYVAQTKELSVHYAKIVLKKYKDSRSKTILSMYEYLFFAILHEIPDYNHSKCVKLQRRILKNWFKCLSKEDLKYLKSHKLTHKSLVYNDLLWFTDNNKDARIYHLKKVISRNSK